MNKTTLLTISLAANLILLAALIHANHSSNHGSDKLSDWELFTLALMKVESNYDSTAISTAGAKGLLQITPIYVEEVNRVHNTKYTFDDVTDFEKSVEIFNLMQLAHNKDFSTDKALTLHNGNHLWYNKRVYKELKQIKQYEDTRAKLKKMNISYN